MVPSLHEYFGIAIFNNSQTSSKIFVDCRAPELRPFEKRKCVPLSVYRYSAAWILRFFNGISFPCENFEKENNVF